MAGTDEAFQLIKSLNSSEKGYFKKYAYKDGSKKENQYLKLFNLMDGHQEYDESVIRNKMKKAFPGKKLAEAKYYLHQLVMSSLIEYHRGNSVDSKLNLLMEELAILYKKGLYSRAFKILRKTKKLAEAHEKFLVCLSLQRWEEELLHVAANYEGIHNYLEEGFEKEEELAEKWLNYRRIRKICIRFFTLIRWQVNIRSKEYRNEIEDLINDPVMEADSRALSLKAKTQRFYVLLKYFRLTGEKEKSYVVRKAHVELLENHPEILRENKMTYLRTLNNLIVMQVELGLYQEALRESDKLEALPLSDLQEKVTRFTTSFDVRIEIANRTGVHEQFAIQPFIDEFKFYEASLSGMHKVIFGYATGLFFFIKGDFKNALHWLDMANSFDREGFLEDYLAIVKILILISHFEMGNYEILDSLRISTYRYLKNRKGAYKLENLFLKYLNQLSHLANMSEFLPRLLKFKEKASKLGKEELEKGMFAHFDLHSWLESKIRKVPMYKILQDKVMMQEVQRKTLTN